MDDYDLGAST
jgi:hypothetical protein